jgi:hypothetical protein
MHFAEYKTILSPTNNMALRCLVWKSLLTVININGNSVPLSFAAKPFADQLLYKKALGRLNSSLPQVR